MTRKKPTNKQSEDKMARLMEEKALFDEFRNTILPGLQRDLLAGKSADEILQSNEAVAAARLVTIATTEPDAGKALAASKALLERVSGKPTEKRDVTHKYEKLKDEEIDAVVATLLEEDQD